MDLEQLKIWQDELNQLQSQQAEVMERHMEMTIAEFIARFRSHELHGRTWRPIPYWSHPGLRSMYKGHQIWVEFQLSKKAMAAILA